MTLPLKIHCRRCGLPQWLPPRQAAGARRLECPRCGHRASAEAVRVVRLRARRQFEPELQLAS